jgi:hypothetical protein
MEIVGMNPCRQKTSLWPIWKGVVCPSQGRRSAHSWIVSGFVASISVDDQDWRGIRFPSQKFCRPLDADGIPLLEVLWFVQRREWWPGSITNDEIFGKPRLGFTLFWR